MVEAFRTVAAQPLGVPEDVVNVEGGAIAHGHPIGATGAAGSSRHRCVQEAARFHADRRRP